MLRKAALIDATFVVLLGALYVVSRVFPAHTFSCVGGMVVVVAAFGLAEFKRGFRHPRDIGLRLDNLPSSFLFCSAFLGPLVLVGVIVACVRGVYRPDHFAVALLLYPLWGVIQQALFQGLFLESFRRLRAPNLGLVATSLLFVAVHYPSRVLMAFSAIAGPMFAWLYLKRPNVLPLGFYHGVLGAFVYYVLRQKDVIGKIAEGWTR